MWVYFLVLLGHIPTQNLGKFPPVFDSYSTSLHEKQLFSLHKHACKVLQVFLIMEFGKLLISATVALLQVNCIHSVVLIANFLTTVHC